MGRSHTLRIVEIVAGRVEDLETASKVKKVELVVDSEEHIDRLLVGHGGGLVRTHLAGIVGLWVKGVRIWGFSVNVGSV